LLEAFRWGPSSRNAQPWRIIVVRTPEAHQKFDEGLSANNQKWATQAPVKMVILRNPEEQPDRNGQSRWLLDVDLASVARLMVLLCLTAMWWAVGWSAHVPYLQWMAPYRAADGSACCDITDCFKAAVTLLSEPTGEMVRVLVSTVEDKQHQQVGVETVVVVPGRSIHRSEDAQSWYCTRAHFQS
jgi:hypothetical protein